MKANKHVCYQDRMRYDPHDDVYRCAVCGEAYKPPQREKELRGWHPWEAPVRIPVFFRWETYWYPWRWYPWRLYR